MIQGKNIVCLGLPSWEGDYMKAIVQMLSVLAQHNKILYVEYQYTYKDVITGLIRKKGAPVKRILGINDRLRTIVLSDKTDIKVLTVPAIYPINWMSDGKMYRFFLKRNSQIIKKSIQKAVDELDMCNPLVINAFNPSYGLPLVGQLQEKLLLYYCYDEISHARWCKKHGTTTEAEFATKADAIVTTSEQLHQSKKAYNDQCFLVKNGVNLDLFQQALVKKKQQGKINKPLTVGYLGSIDDRLDYELLTYCIQQLPEVHYHFVGRVTYPQGKECLMNYSNVQFLGAQPPEKLPDFVAQFDIGIIPFVSNGFTQSIYPLKINEYLAAGLPVITTDFGKLRDFKEIATIVSQPEDFLEAIRQYQQGGKLDNIEELNSRITFAQANSWENRAEELSQVIETVIEQKKTTFQKTY